MKYWLLFLNLLAFGLGKYDESIAYRSVQLAEYSYCMTNTSYDCQDCIVDYVLEKMGTRVIQGYDKMTQTIFTSFRGSSNTYNWIENMEVSKIAPYENQTIKVDGGFYKYYDHVKMNVFDNLKVMSARYNTRDLLLTGHSLGSAGMTLMTYDILYDFPEYNILYFYNFGSPRVGNDMFVADFNAKKYFESFRVTHYYDMVPHLPPEDFYYKHISREIWYNEENTQYKVCDDDEDEDDSCSNSCAPTKCTSVDDHMNYLNVSIGSSGC